MPASAPSLRIKVLTVEPTAGLGNRMRVVAAALALADRLACRLRLVWTRTGALGCRFDELFEPLPGVDVAEHAWTTSRLERAAGSLLGWHQVIAQAELERWKQDGLHRLGQLRRPYVITYNRFLPAPGYLARLAPTPRVARAVQDATSRFTPYTIGVHIRRGENDPATYAPLTAPVEAFLGAMHARVALEPRTTFFLATDSPAEEARVASEFGSRVTMLPKSLDRWTTAAIQGALVDLLCLARTTVILGSEWSSFSEIAAEMGGTRLFVVGQDTGRAPGPLAETTAR